MESLPNHIHLPESIKRHQQNQFPYKDKQDRNGCSHHSFPSGEAYTLQFQRTLQAQHTQDSRSQETDKGISIVSL